MRSGWRPRWNWRRITRCATAAERRVSSCTGSSPTSCCPPCARPTTCGRCSRSTNCGLRKMSFCKPAPWRPTCRAGPTPMPIRLAPSSSCSTPACWNTWKHVKSIAPACWVRRRNAIADTRYRSFPKQKLCSKIAPSSLPEPPMLTSWKWRLRPCLYVSVALLAGCASMSEEECLTADWYERGVLDGRRGEPGNYVHEHHEACAKVGVTPDNEAWQRGRSVGIRYFCTPENGERVGLEGRAYRHTCPPE